MTACPAPPLTHERSNGAAHVTLLPGPNGGRLDRLHQKGSAKAFLHPAESGPEIVLLNTSGGLTGGDRLSCRIDLAPGCRATGTTQTAERAYRSTTGAASVTVHHTVGTGGHLDWLPQETILFEGSHLVRDTTIDLAADAACLMLESVVLGRAAMGETVTRVTLRDTRRITRAGRPVLVEPLHLSTDALTAGPAILNGARAFATLALVAQGAEDAVTRARAELTEPGVTGGASGFDGKLVIRLMAADGWPLRRQIMRLVRALRPGPLPRVWQF
ncbi:urease accessory protein UreD [Aquicoccus porphyridii]|uniref:Urease accessory protein UreD n=1 Tax=Aquicoccus porphyridii TaxID=1852029 RepID=A0A5A9YZ10_9RHOB|nr:urease accessory protein UreD [Aquicoccus porphyridii]KAA0910088.1 urease accessory protein UreD [Aquicoccus porphyridii]RAI53466.1 urease accessory protein UreD [Rhodobacteraceae bacterium AsT-22]